MKGYPSWFNYKLISSIFSVLLLSGILLIPQMLEFRLEQDISVPILKEFKALTTGLHIISGFFIFMILGSVWAIHMRVEWKRGQKRLNSVLLLSFFILSLLTATFLLYGSSEDLLVPVSISHVGVGLLLAIFFAYHVLKKSN